MKCRKPAESGQAAVPAPAVSLRAATVLAIFLVAATTVAPAVAQEDADCYACHAEPDPFEGLERAEALVVPEATYAASIHGEAGLACVDCHQDLAEGDLPHPERLQPVECGTCHEDVRQTFDGSLHGYARLRGSPRAPDCADCHGTHDIRPSAEPDSRTHKTHVPALCATCHGAAGLTTEQLVRLPRTAAGYAESVHGKGLANGEEKAASCVDCHGVHDLLGPGDPRSRIHPFNAAATCGQCHDKVAAEYRTSIHGMALAAGITDSPTCTNCHGEHAILSPSDPDAHTYAARLATETCGGCHDDPEIVQKYGLEGGVVGSYVDSYHGWATRADYERAASCVSCHTAHSVLPSESPTSTTNAANVVETCRTCHPRADAKFAASYTHVTASIEANPINRAIRLAYVLLIAIVIGGMLLHNAVIMNYFAIEHRRHEEKASVRRFDGSQIVQHALLTVSFVTLVVTGFALRFPDAWWVRYLSEIGMSESVRRWTHRIAGLVLIATALLHVWYVFFTTRGRVEIKAMLPDRQDVPGFLQNMKFHTWRSRQPARFGRYDYTQKAEYWALVWGTILMILTGFVLWFPATAVRILPSWAVPASQTVHYYEAWLATLAIVVWHFFFVILHPEQYPMSWTWLTGRMSESAVRHHHGRWWEEEFAHAAERPKEAAGRAQAPPAEQPAARKATSGSGSA